MKKSKLLYAARKLQPSRNRARAGAALVSLGLTASLLASPAVKGGTPVYPRVSHSGQPLGNGLWQQVGRASWYGGSFNGRKTATGERFDMHALTCAHRTLPLGTWVRVTNLVNHKFTFLRVNDRGPMARAFIVDLSMAAAQKLGIAGLGHVRIEAVTPSSPALAQQLVAQIPMANDPVVVASAQTDRTLPLLADEAR